MHSIQISHNSHSVHKFVRISNNSLDYGGHQSRLSCPICIKEVAGAHLCMKCSKTGNIIYGSKGNEDIIVKNIFSNENKRNACISNTDYISLENLFDA